MPRSRGTGQSSAPLRPVWLNRFSAACWRLPEVPPTRSARFGREVAVTALAPPPQSESTTAAGDFDPQTALLQTIALNRGGQHIEASRIANDALSRLPADAPAATRAELALEAALADSNIRFGQTAAEHFARADAIIASAPNSTSGFLTSKRDTYKALDLINQGQFQAALTLLNRIAGEAPAIGQPLEEYRDHQRAQPVRRVARIGAAIGRRSQRARARQAAASGAGELGKERGPACAQ